MELFVQIRAFDSINEPEAVQQVRRKIGERMQRLQKTGNLVESRTFADQRGGFLLIEAEDASEVRKLLGTEILDHFHVEMHPTTSFEELGRFFEGEQAG